MHYKDLFITVSMLNVWIPVWIWFLEISLEFIIFRDYINYYKRTHGDVNTNTDLEPIEPLYFRNTTKPNQTKLNQFKSIQINSNQFKSIQINSNQFKSMQVNANQILSIKINESNQIKPIQTNSIQINKSI